MDLSARNTKAGALEHLKSLGFQPAVVIDVGVQQGTYELYRTFPESLHILIEPVAEQEPHLQTICSELPFATYLIAAASDTTGQATLRITNNFQYSGLISASSTEAPSTHFDRVVQTVALDDLCQNESISGPILLKIDVDGAELSVLRGSIEILKDKVQYLVIEATLFHQIHHIIEFMTQNDFVLYDNLEHLYRPLDGALWQVDLAFVPKNSALRSNHAYATPQEIKKLSTE